ncbi:MAG: hypothetical protein V3V51_06690, partial [Desulfobacterales bacterium]
LGFLYSVAMNMLLYRQTIRHNSALRRQLINQIIYPQISQIYTDLKNYKEILEYLFLRNLWIINANFAVGWEGQRSEISEKNIYPAHR